MKLLLMVLLLLAGNRAYASPVNVSVHNIEGIDSILQIEVDGDNRKWVRARSGLYMYNGHEWTSFKMGSDIPSSVYDIFIDYEGKAWFGTSDGIVKWDEGEWLAYNSENIGMPAKLIQQIYISANGVWWVSTFNELYRYDGDEWTIVETYSTSMQSYADMIVAEDGSIWMLSSPPYLWGKKSIEDPLSRIAIGGDNDIGNEAGFLVETVSGMLQIGHGLDVWEYDIHSTEWKLITRNPSTNSFDRSLNMVLFGDEGFRWFFSESIVHNRGEDWSELMFGKDIDGAENYIDAVLDHDNVLWAIGRNGIVSIEPGCLFLCSPHENPWDWETDTYIEHWYPGEDITITWIARDAEALTLSCSMDGITWKILANNLDPGLSRYDWRIPDEIIPHGEYTSKLEFAVTSVDGLSDTTMITVERPGFKDAFVTQPLCTSGISDACQTPDGCLWFATDRLFKYDGAKWMEYEISGNIYQIENAPDGTIWLSTREGIFMFDGNKWKHWFDDITAEDQMVVTATGEVWLSHIEYLPDIEGFYKRYQRLYRLHDEEWVDMLVQLGMSDFIIRLLTSDPAGNLWIHGYRLSETPASSECLIYDSASGGLEVFSLDMSPSELFWDNQGTMWRITNSNYGDILHHYRNGMWDSFPLDPVFRYDNNSRLLFINTDNANRLWFNSDIGILVFDGETWRRHFSEHTNIFTLTFIDRDNNKWLTKGNSLICFTESRVLVTSNPAPTSFSFDTPYPNPFNLSVTIPFSLPEAARVEVSIYSITGQKVRELCSDRLSAGAHTLRWDGRDTSGAEVSSGMYICRIRSGSNSAVKRITLVR